jgi:hypothetical protein
MRVKPVGVKRGIGALDPPMQAKRAPDLRHSSLKAGLDDNWFPWEVWYAQRTRAVRPASTHAGAHRCRTLARWPRPIVHRI